MGSDTARPENGGLKDISIHAPRMGSDNKAILSPLGERAFQSTLPAWGATPGRAAVHVGIHHFNPRSPHGERRRIRPRRFPSLHFNPRSPHGERREGGYLAPDEYQFQSTLPAWGATLSSDVATKHGLFQSTLPAWGATTACWATAPSRSNFNPRSPHGERRRGARSAGETSQISIHAPRMGSDQMENETMRLVLAFQSTLPAWGATRFRQRGQGRRSDFNPRSPHGERRQQLHAGHPQRAISIHAPRMGSDNRESAGDAHSLYFNPRSPHGERPEGLYSSPFFQHFNPRSPHGERHQADGISASVVGDFNPRSPHGERPAGATGTVYDPEFQSTLPAWGATFTPCPSVDAPKPFQSTLPAWGATSCCMRICAM